MTSNVSRKRRPVPRYRRGVKLPWWLDKELRDIRGTRHYTVAALPEVTVGRIVGVAKPLAGPGGSGVTEAALSGRPCLAYVAKVRGAVGAVGLGLADGGMMAATGVAHGGTKTEDIIAETGGLPFLVEDETGVAIVDPTGAHGAFEIDDTSSWFEGPTERDRAFLARYAMHDKLGLAFHEGIVSVGETVAVVGFGQRVNGQLRMSSSPRLPLVICDNHATVKT